MNLSVVMNIHEDSDLVFDTLDSVRKYMTDNILVVIDGEFWGQLKNSEIRATKVEGLRHGSRRAPYRNITLGLMKAAEEWPDVDWCCYLEPDCLVGADTFRRELEIADQMGAWCVGNDHRIGNVAFPLINTRFNINITESHYLLGCCIFYNRKYIQKLVEMNFFNQFLDLTNFFSQGFFPAYTGHDITEHLYPSLAVYLGGKVQQFANYIERKQQWGGNYTKFPMRYRPELNGEFPNAAILHPIKNFNNPIREFYRKKRNHA
jgi:hypothetical protein